MTSTEIIVGALVEVQALLIAWAIYPKLFSHRSPRS
jgi:hypothetical protein